ncbi:MAG TPA: amylo-alpha-1,6-glucosidase, partial [Roseiflexaceae bacterium]|nr:amylo-alpha-1,6-glucosidase [Roseiflexaceae bacterium]
MTHQRFVLTGRTIWEAASEAATPVYLAGPRLYTIGTIGGVVAPFGEWHLQGLMGGAWAHPIRVLHGWSLELQQGDDARALVADSCDLFGSHVVRHYVTPVLELDWTEFVPDEHAALAGFVDVRNPGPHDVSGRLGIRAELDLRGCWFGGWAVPELHAETRDDVLVVTGAGRPFAQRAAALAAGTDAQWTVTGTTATASLDFTLPAGSAVRIPISLAVSHAGGPQEAMQLAFQVR